MPDFINPAVGFAICALRVARDRRVLRERIENRPALRLRTPMKAALTHSSASLSLRTFLAHRAAGEILRGDER